ncbi:hypothetical protein [Streptomyces sp. NBC_01483]|uniref:hypothetical protein n=1 Tax=Streptomyces sp. NBC_01483 TaxID=2903883 RepID=UPI002E2F4021|nr:hypothetical protein [Streptomyces sp. NBC_01483]
MTLTITDVRTGLALPDSADDRTGTGRHRGGRADEDGCAPERDSARHGRHRRTVRASARDENADLGWEHHVADDLAALEAVILREKTLRTDRARDL